MDFQLLELFCWAQVKPIYPWEIYMYIAENLTFYYFFEATKEDKSPKFFQHI